jgi:D-glycero-alpha-D-manno-heptose-7-phosphate kinase
MRITSKAPCRVDLAGGTLDIWPLYLFHAHPVTVNFAVDRYTSCVIETRNDREIHLHSEDLNVSESFGSLGELRGTRKHKLPLVAQILRFFTPESGIDVRTNSEAPAGAGISGSSALIIATTNAFNKMTEAGYTLEQLREISQNIEAQIIRVPTGCQDYYPAMYGGISAIELGPTGIHRVEIKIPHEELIKRVVLAYTGEPRNSGINNWEVTKAHIDGDTGVHKNFDKIAAIANGMRSAVERQDWKDVGRLVREEWTNRRKNAPGITTPLIDHLVEVTRKAGSTGAKVCGAGGGGCVLFLVEPDAKQKIVELIEREGAKVLNVTVAPRGVRVQVEKETSLTPAHAR